MPKPFSNEHESRLIALTNITTVAQMISWYYVNFFRKGTSRAGVFTYLRNLRIIILNDYLNFN